MAKTLINVTGSGTATFTADAGSVVLTFTLPNNSDVASAVGSASGFADALLSTVDANSLSDGLNETPVAGAIRVIPQIEGGFLAQFDLFVDFFDGERVEEWLDNSGLLDNDDVFVTTGTVDWSALDEGAAEAVSEARVAAYTDAEKKAEDYLLALSGDGFVVNVLSELGTRLEVERDSLCDDCAGEATLGEVLSETPLVSVTVELAAAFTVRH